MRSAARVRRFSAHAPEPLGRHQDWHPGAREERMGHAEQKSREHENTVILPTTTGCKGCRTRTDRAEATAVASLAKPLLRQCAHLADI